MELKFKKGDWIKCNGQLHQFFEYDEGIDCRLCYAENDKYIGTEDQCELWGPKENEWCWFWNKDEQPQLGKLTRVDKHVRPYCADYTRYGYCEPFIGQLPTTIKGNKNGN